MIPWVQTQDADCNPQHPAREGDSPDQFSSRSAEAPISASGRGSTQTLGKHVPRKLAIEELCAGLHLPGTLFDRNGRILLAAGMCLTETHINTLIRPSRGGVYAGDDWPDEPQETLTAEAQDDAPTVQTMAPSVAKRAERLLRMKFRLLPSTMRAEYRILGIPPEKIFEPGDTLRVGQAGLLFPVTDSPGDSMCVEVHLIWPTGRERFYLGGVMGVITEFGIHWMCLKLHTVPRKAHEMVVELARPGPWFNSVPS